MEGIATKPTFQKYPAYKDSGVEWLGEIPEYWEAIKMKYLFRDVSEKNKPEAELLSVTQDQGVVPRTWVENRMVMPSGNLESFKFIRKGDFAISLRSFEGGLEYCHHDGIISPAYTVLKKKNGLFDMYYKYLFKSKSFISEIQTSVVGIREGKNISYFELSYSLLPIPPHEEQTVIAAFLDDKTAKIDLAIAQKEKMIALLKERKQIIIQNAVTKGLNPNAKMKDSGVEWIGEIPEGWEVSKAKFYSKIFVPERTKPELDEDFHSGIPWITTDLLGNDYLDIQKAKYFVNSKNARIAGSRIVKKDSILATCVGNFGIASINSFDCIINQQIQGYTQIKLNPVYFIQIVRLSKDFFSNNSTMTTIQYVSKDTFGDLPILIPTIQEQTAIVAHIETQSDKIDKAIGLQEQQIEKLKELKATLIDGAVTGKIKVR